MAVSDKVGNWKDLLPEKKESVKESLEERINFWSQWFLPPKGFYEILMWVTSSLAVPSLGLTLWLMLLKYFPGVSWATGLIGLFVVVGLVCLCKLQWSTARLWICVRLALGVLSLVVNGPHIVAIWF